ncbi:MAG TPA: molybdopterin-dependent oxidoreductase [Dissulfurispiraceae bacterium]|nr:molybdopterin-dependent oxidoreductase [Dissulfurispiraceae bacterium]
MINVTIDGKQSVLEKPVTILQAVRGAGIEVPTLCNHELLEAYGGCRLCLVEIDKVPRLQPSCTQYVTDGMVIRTNSETVLAARRAALEFILINHPLDCPSCDKAGECELQDAVMKYGVSTSFFSETKRTVPENLEDPLIVRNMQRCISCTRCVRMCSQVQGAYALSMVNRSGRTGVEPFSGGRFDCEYCGNCLSVCPVGALLSKPHRHVYRSWMIDREIAAPCPFCGAGCELRVQIRDDAIVRVVSQDSGSLCNRGRFGYDSVKAAERLVSPLIRSDAGLTEVSWDAALSYVAQRLQKIKDEHGGASICGIASVRRSNEDNYAFRKLFRDVLGSSNIDSAAGLSYAPTRSLMEKLLGKGAVDNSMADVLSSDAVLIIGGDPTSVNPAFGLQLRALVKRGTPVITVGHMPGFNYFDTIRINIAPSSETVFLSAIVSGLIRTKAQTAPDLPVIEALKKMRHIGQAEAARLCDIPESDLFRAITTLESAIRVYVIIGPELAQKADGYRSLVLAAGLLHLLQGRVSLLSEAASSYGAVKMGCCPDDGTGCASLSPGLNIMEMMDAAISGRLKAMWVMGEDPLCTLPGREHVVSALSGLDLLIVHDSFLTGTAKQADVVLPAPFWIEQEGSFTTHDGLTRRFGKGLISRAPEGWRTITEISRRLGFDLGYEDTKDVSFEIASLPQLQGEDYPACMTEKERDLIMLTLMAEFSTDSEEGKIYAVPEFPLLGLGQGYGFSRNLNEITGKPYVRIGSRLSERLSITDGDEVEVSAETGSLRLRAVVDPGLPDGIVALPYFPEETGILAIAEWDMNPLLKTPVLDRTEVMITRVVTGK